MDKQLIELAAQNAALRDSLEDLAELFDPLTAKHDRVYSAARSVLDSADLAGDAMRQHAASVLDAAATTFHCRSLKGDINGERLTSDEMTGCMYATVMLRAMSAEICRQGKD